MTSKQILFKLPHVLLAIQVPHFLLAATLLISGREEGEIRRHHYQVSTPSNTAIHQIDSDLRDTMKPNLTIWIADKIKVTIHSFPSQTLSDRIPPIAQVARWKEGVDSSTQDFCHFNGYCGLQFVGVKGDQTTLAWALAVDPDLYQMERLATQNDIEMAYAVQKTADVTIKAVGPTALIEANKEELMSLATSFQTLSPFSP